MLKSMVSPRPTESGQLSAHAYQPSAKGHSHYHQEHTPGANYRVRACVGEGHSTLRLSMGQLGNLQAKHPQQLQGRLPDGVEDMVNRTCVPFMPLESPTCHSPIFSFLNS